MIRFNTLAESRTPDGGRLTLHEHDGEYYIKLNGRQLMSSIATASEIAMAELASQNLSGRASILIGGLGLGFTLKRALELLSPDSSVHVAELLNEVIEWNREFLGALNGSCLQDPRVEVMARDVFELLAKASPGSYDAIMLDVDNGPVAMVQSGNSRLYERNGFMRISRALKSHGRAVFWSACEDAPFARRLSKAGFRVEAVPAKSHAAARRSVHVLYVADRLA